MDIFICRSPVTMRIPLMLIINSCQIKQRSILAGSVFSYFCSFLHPFIKSLQGIRHFLESMGWKVFSFNTFITCIDQHHTVPQFPISSSSENSSCPLTSTVPDCRKCFLSSQAQTAPAARFLHASECRQLSYSKMSSAHMKLLSLYFRFVTAVLQAVWSLFIQFSL